MNGRGGILVGERRRRTRIWGGNVAPGWSGIDIADYKMVISVPDTNGIRLSHSLFCSLWLCQSWQVGAPCNDGVVSPPSSPGGHHVQYLASPRPHQRRYHRFCRCPAHPLSVPRTRPRWPSASADSLVHHSPVHSPDPGGQYPVAELRRLAKVSFADSSYCEAAQRLPVPFFQRLSAAVLDRCRRYTDDDPRALWYYPGAKDPH
jgi:hypothetical protein